jgi:S-adenosylmethionine-dependent carboxyl methyltransferase
VTEKENTGAASGELGVMEGKGFYNRHSRPQRGAVAFGLPLLEQAVEAVPLPGPGGVFQVADYGVAGGNNSMEPMRTVIEGIGRRASGDLAVSVFHTDLPTNDFDPLFTLLTSPESYLQGTSNVFAYAGGGSFYERLFPDSHIDIGWNAIAVHWLSRVPATIPDHIWSNRATGKVKEAFARQSEGDWQAFLGHRTHELRPGGRLVVLGGASDEEGGSGAEGLMDMANASLQEMVDNGVLRPEEYERMVIPTYNRMLKEFEAPFSANPEDNPLQLESSSEVALPDPFWPEYEESHDARAFGTAYEEFFRAAYGPSLFGALDADRTPQETEQISDAFYDSLRDKATADPATASCNWRVVLLLITKKAEGQGDFQRS